MNNIGIIGLGNPLRHDDGIGIELLGFLQKEKDTSYKEAELIDAGTGGMNLLHLLSRFDVAVLIDAVDFKGKPGETRLFTLSEIQQKKTPIRLSTHESDFISVLALSKQLNELPQRLYVFGVQPYDLSFGIGLSTQLKKQLPDLKKTLKKEIQQVLSEK
ncbi:MAG: hydrogenase maturation protease [Candidatus Thermoplasmatota archaeon]|nr:hydrogenase maturation protease [Candidatus Thermoplasmatota archaeon]